MVNGAKIPPYSNLDFLILEMDNLISTLKGMDPNDQKRDLLRSELHLKNEQYRAYTGVHYKPAPAATPAQVAT